MIVFRKHWMPKIALILVAALMAAGAPGTTAHAAQPSAPDVPSIQILAAEKDKSVTLRTHNFPANTEFEVLMGLQGTRGIGGARVEFINSRSGGSFTRTFAIPKELLSQERIVVRLQGTTTTWFAFNTFTNATVGVRPAPDARDKTSVPVQKDADAIEQVAFQQRADIFAGRAGAFFPSSNYTGFAALQRLDPTGDLRDRNLEFAQRLLELRLFNQQGNEFERAFGLNYVYFNLSRMDRIDWQTGDLSIYRFDRDLARWVNCPSHLVETKNPPHGRLACVVPGFGLFGLARER